MEDLVVKLVETEQERQGAFDIRIRVFVHEQGVPPEEELDRDDDIAIHAIALLRGEPVGTGRLVRMESGEAKIGRMAVEQAQRRGGIGGRILERLEDAGRQQGMAEAILHAQTYVKSFYASHGYVEEGDVFMEVDIEHIQMRKRL